MLESQTETKISAKHSTDVANFGGLSGKQYYKQKTKAYPNLTLMTIPDHDHQIEKRVLKNP